MPREDAEGGRAQQSEVQELQAELARRLTAVGKMFVDLGTERGAADLLERLVADDRSGFHALLDRYDLPIAPLGKCVWVRELIDLVLTTPTETERCVVRSDLTPSQKLAVIAIGARHLVLFTGGDIGGQVVASGPLLDELKNRGFVSCSPTVASGSGPSTLLGPPQRFCV